MANTDTEELAYPAHGTPHDQVLHWHDAREEVPELKRVCLIKVPFRPWLFSGKGDLNQKVAILSEIQVEKEGDPPYRFEEMGPHSFDYDEVTEWAYLDE